MLFLLSFTLISCKTYKNSEVNSIGIIGSADGPTAIYIKVNPNFLIQKSLDIIQNLCLLAKDSTYINYSTNNTEIIKVIDNSDYPFMHLLYSQLLVCQRVCLQNTVCLICK